MVTLIGVLDSNLRTDIEIRRGGDVVEHSGPRHTPIQSGAIMGASRGSREEQWFITSGFM